MAQGGSNPSTRALRQRRGLLGRVPAPLGLLLLLAGAFLLGRGGGSGQMGIALALMVAGAAVLRAWRVRGDAERRLLEQAAYTDPLTGLSNRRQLHFMLRHEINRHVRIDGRFVVLMLDLDGFKEINDVHGHDAGDVMLCNVADALTATVRAQDTVARLGGDEFCVVAPDTEDEKTLAQRVVRAVAGAGRGYEHVSGTVGLAIFPEDGASAEKLLSVADSRMIAAKRGRDRGGQRHEAGERGVRTAA